MVSHPKISHPNVSHPNVSHSQPILHRLDFFDSPSPAQERDLLMPFAQFVGKLTDYPSHRVDPQTGQVMTIEQLTVDLPIELKVISQKDGTMTVKGSPPTQGVQTTVMPVFHQMRLRIVRENAE